MMDVDLIFGDARDKLKLIKDKSVSLVVTSPPYDNIRSYDSNQWNFDVFKGIADELPRVLTDDGIIVWIVGDSTKNGDESGNSFRQALYFKDIGLKLHDTMIWQKICLFQQKNRYIQSFDYMFIFSKKMVRNANIITDRKNKWGGTQVHGTERQQDGTVKPLSTKQKSKQIKEWGARYNIWEMSPEKHNKTGHPATFPVQLAADHIRSWSKEDDLVLDPMMGSGSTGLASLSLYRRFVGIESNRKYFDEAVKRIHGESLEKAKKKIRQNLDDL